MSSPTFLKLVGFAARTCSASHVYGRAVGDVASSFRRRCRCWRGLPNRWRADDSGAGMADDVPRVCQRSRADQFTCTAVRGPLPYFAGHRHPSPITMTGRRSRTAAETGPRYRHLQPLRAPFRRSRNLFSLYALSGRTETPGCYGISRITPECAGVRATCGRNGGHFPVASCDWLLTDHAGSC